MKSVKILIKGRVQGVFFRASARDEALRLGLVGWIRNTAEGDVEALATGDDLSLRAFADWCRRGPELAKVQGVEVSEVPVEQFTGFEILRG